SWLSSSPHGDHTAHQDDPCQSHEARSPVGRGPTAMMDPFRQARNLPAAGLLLLALGSLLRGSAGLASVTGPGGSGYSLTRNAANHVTALSPNSGGQHAWTIDGEGRPSAATDPVNATETVTRDLNGNPTVIVDRKGQRTEITRGTGDRVTQVVYKRADGTVESTVTYTYSGSTDLLTSISDTAGPGYS